MGYVKTHKNKFICIILLTLISFVYSITMSLHFMPFPEGWYSYYAWLINNGAVPYRDFSYLFSPLYLYFISFITKIFGYDIYVLRILGCFIYAFIAVLLFLLLAEIFEEWVSFLGSIASVLYLQTEVAQVFYDYVRVMDVFVMATVFFLILSIKSILSEEKYVSLKIFSCGFFCSCFVLIKQNMGLIFWAFILFAYLITAFYKKINKEKAMKIIFLFIISSCCIPIILFIYMYYNGTLGLLLQSTGGDAIAAKGGMFAILFNWIIKQPKVYLKKAPISCFIAVIIMLLKFYNGKLNGKNKIKGMCFPLFFTCLFLLLFYFLCEWESLGLNYLRLRIFYLSPYVIFVSCVILLIFYIKESYNCLSSHEKNNENFLISVLLGSYFAISYGCGTSGGLAEGQATIGVAVLVCLLFHYLNYDFKNNKIILNFLVILTIMFSLYSCDKKMAKGYYWWGSEEFSIWQSKYYSNVPALKHIKMSKEQKDVYNAIYDEILKNTNNQDRLYTFPQIPIFYVLTNRQDPGVYAKVEWFDVTSKKALSEDMLFLNNHMPKAILIYNTKAFAYREHEKLFNNGKISATRKMREFLYNLVYKKGYKNHGNYFSGQNNLQLYILPSHSDVSKSIFCSGDGSFEDPYTINSVEQLKIFATMVNDGRNFDGIYIKLISDIDLQGSEITPIGLSSLKAHFDGYFNGNGHIIRNFVINNNGNAGLFDDINGIVQNVTLIDGYICGNKSGAIACESKEKKGYVINCFSDVQLFGNNPGGLVAKDFHGVVVNGVNGDKINELIMAPNVYSFNNAKKNFIKK